VSGVAGEEAADVLEFAHAGDRIADAPGLEVSKRELHEVAEEPCAELDVDAVGGVTEDMAAQAVQDRLTRPIPRKTYDLCLRRKYRPGGTSARAATPGAPMSSHAAYHSVQGADEFTCFRPQVALRGTKIFDTKRRGHMRQSDQGVAFPLHRWTKCTRQGGQHMLAGRKRDHQACGQCREKIALDVDHARDVCTLQLRGIRVDVELGH